MRGIVDRFEGDYVVIEFDGLMQDVVKSSVADNVQEGDVVALKDGIWIRDASATEQRSQEMRKLMGRVWEDE